MSTEPPSPTSGTTRTGVLVPVAAAQRAAQLASVAGLTADAVPGPGGVLLVPRSPQTDDAPVARLSRLLRGADVLVLRLANQRVDVARWRAGHFVDNPSYGEIGGVAGDSERVLLGSLPAAEAEGVVSADDVDSREAARAIMSTLVGPVRTWEFMVTAVLIALAALLALVAGLDLASGGWSPWNAVRVVAWLVVGVVLARRLRGLLSRRRRERQTR